MVVIQGIKRGALPPNQAMEPTLGGTDVYAFRWRSLLSLKGSVIVTFLVLWNTGFLFAMSLDGGMLRTSSRRASALIAIICFSACVFSVGIAASARLRAICLAPSRQHDFRSFEFYLVAACTAIVALFELLNSLTGAFSGSI